MIPKAAIDLIKRFEGYAKARPDGSCEAYQEVINGKADRPTIGWGCTKGVTIGMVWSRAEAEEALTRELEIHAKRVTRLVTVELNVNQRGALISFDYNTGGLTLGDGKASKVLRLVNAGELDKVPDALREWSKFGGKVSKGLVARRAAEVALWLTPTEDVKPDFMPQEPERQRKMTAGEAASVAGGLGTGVATAAHQTGSIPTTLYEAKQAVAKGQEIKQVARDAKELIPGLPLAYAVPAGVLIAAVAAIVIMRRRSA